MINTEIDLTSNKRIPISVIDNTSFQSSIMKRDCISLEALEKITSEYYLQKKYNGCYTLLIIDDHGVAKAYNKNMAIVPNLDKALEEATRKLVWGRVYLSEAIVLKNELEDFEEASRSFNPNNNVIPNGAVKLVIFDSITLQEFIVGKSELTFKDRWEEIIEIKENYCDWFNLEFADTYLIGSFNQLTYMYNYGLTKLWEGVIISLTNSLWNRRTSICKTSWKLIPIPTIDLEIVGYTTGKGKHTGVAATLKYKARQWLKEDSPVVFLDIDGALNFATRKDIVENFDKYKGRISKISYKGFTRYGKLRQPKILEVIRYDKLISDIK